ncbi:response regulator [Candidatus Woesearchaeota archaeon]|nr:response regulator [Candidatus Woesearchaeota archaeon]
MEKILIIEDNAEEAACAQSELEKAGFKDVKTVTNLSDGLDAMPQYGAVLSDLFFPAGNTQTEQYSQRFLPFYEQFKQIRFPKIGKEDSVLGAIEVCAETFGMTPQEYVDNVLAKLNTPEIVLKKARDVLAGVEDSERYEKFLKIEEGIRDGTNLPLGIIACERAAELGMPAVIVTSTYHHSDAFEPVRDLIKVSYRDILVDEKKDWKGGIELLLR